jgi:inositol-phosphate phosphatase/L-galactose 1-phosphate phosphatase/histidinol-phosphatase
MNTTDEYLAFSHALADASGVVLRRYFRVSLAEEEKEDRSPVTQADREAEAELRALIAARYPAHGFLGEESGGTGGGAEYCWVIDPIDGTRNFMTGQPIFGTLIALLRRGTPVLGIIDQPITRERWVGVAGSPTTLNGQKVRARAARESLERCVLSTTSPYLFSEEKRVGFERLRARALHTVLGSDCYAYAVLAAGHLDLVAESGLKAHDVMALIPVIEGAGGVITDWQGAPLRFAPGETDVLAAANAALHRRALEVLAEGR